MFGNVGCDYASGSPRGPIIDLETPASGEAWQLPLYDIIETARSVVSQHGHLMRVRDVIRQSGACGDRRGARL
ncbi:MAG: hypothetical protein QOF66_3071 [Mycobacterium sp.]|nr:hypothetical protein [Mycobacterium sp.]